jgi:hypothetical protein
MTAPDEAVVTFHGNGYTSADRVLHAALRCAEGDLTFVTSLVRSQTLSVSHGS